MSDTSLDRLRLLGRLEALSFLLLLGIAMPLKYLAAMPVATKIVGWPHGLLFIAYYALVLRAGRTHGLSLRLMATLFIAALIPFGPLLAERRLPQPNPLPAA